MPAFGFDQQGVKRIVAAVKRIERSAPANPRGLNPNGGGGAPFWAELTDEDEGAYSWKLIYPDTSAGSGWSDADPAVTGTLNAYEASDATGLFTSDPPRRVLMFFVGYADDSAGTAQYVFSASANSGSRDDPTTLSGSGGTADTATWNIDTDGTPVNLALATRIFYDDTAHKFFQFTRVLKIDSSGRVYDIGAESKEEIVELEECS